MEELEETPPKYIEGFNTGYIFSKSFPDAGKQILEIYSSEIKNKSTDKEFNPTEGMIHGINQHIEEQEKKLSNERINDLKNIRNQQGGENEHEIKR